MPNSRLSRAEILSFLLNHIVVEKAHKFEMSQFNLFQLTNLATEAENRLNQEENLIPHELIEEIAGPFIESI